LTRRTYDTGGKRVYYLSLEFLIGRLMRDALSNMGLTNEMEQALREHGLDLAQLEELEPDAALGNGGLGRLAACFMESLASLDIPAYGYGIRYLNGMFRQRIDDGWQVELPETWLSHGNPWEFDRRESSYLVGFGGEVADQIGRGHLAPAGADRGQRRRYARRRLARETREHAAPVDGQCADPLQLDAFNAGDHAGALAAQVRANSLVRVLYPADSTPAGQELRLRQEYFFSSASIQDIVRRHVQYDGDVRTLPEKAAIQLNDTHPSVAVAELMRLLIDVHGLEFNEAWEVTKRTIGYTNHTLLPEALETGRCRCSSGCCRATCRSSMRSTAASCARRARRDGRRAIAAISLIDEGGAACAWPTSPSWAPIRSTASPRCTPN
jgi:starch phosphorylase